MHDSLGPPESKSQTASLSVQPFLHSSRQSVVGDVGACSSPQNCPFHGYLNTHLAHRSSGLPYSASQPASRSGQPFMHNYSRQKIHILYNGPLHPEIAHSHGGSEPTSNTLRRGHTRVKNPNGISIGSAVFRTTRRRVSLYFTLGRSLSPQNCPFPWGI